MTTLSNTTIAVLYLLILSLLTGLSVFSARGGVTSENLLGKIASQVNHVGCGLLWLGSAMLFVGFIAQSIDGWREFFVGMARWGTRLAFFAVILVITGSISQFGFQRAMATSKNVCKNIGAAVVGLFNGFVGLWMSGILSSKESEIDDISHSGLFYNQNTGKHDDGYDINGHYPYDFDSEDY